MDLLIICITLALGVIGTLWETPSKFVKWAIIALLLASSSVSLLKSRADSQEKDFLRNLISAGLYLPDSAYDEIEAEIDKALRQKNYKQGANCYHSADGLICHIKTPPAAPKALLAFNRLEVARIFADKESGKETAPYIRQLIEKQYYPELMTHDFQEKVGLIGYLTFFSACGENPLDYTYNYTNGVTVRYKDGKLIFYAKDLAAVKADTAPLIFARISEVFQKQIADAGIKQCAAK